ncbi:related to endo-1,6-beta-d-glucanase precursor [Sporisorium reilianum SRZ2]|uniref:Related to endo-1,6-beta-d-glucanase n=1 Tax=Sporisorium reilianum (strain SRZ2) TaxID=999809 RepID=E6ZPL7_SPORE|nr:related to endo-1,6-beta-d-glucanase precursor [Sporisorium reilianum SRZ2]
MSKLSKLYGKSGGGHGGGQGSGDSLSFDAKPVLPTSHRTPRKNKAAAWWSTLNAPVKIVYAALAVIAVLALVLGLALGLTLGKPKEDPSPAADYVPSSISGNRTSLLQPGYWYTAPSNGTNFAWTAASAQLGSFRADSQGVDIVINTTRTFQEIDGFGGAMTDSSAYLLDRLKTREVRLYERVMDFMFNNATGVGVTRVTLGASDFSLEPQYTYIATAPNFTQAAAQLNDPSSLLRDFSLDGTQSSAYTIPVLVDALKRNPRLKVILTPWSPPGFMKSNNTMDGGTLRTGFVDVLAQYYAQAAQAWTRAGVRPWAMTLQNEPSNLAAYPSMGMDAPTQVQLAVALKRELAQRGLGDVQVWAHDDNYSGWQSAAQIVNANANASAVDAVAFHCYRGAPAQIAQFEAALQANVSKRVHMSECTGTGNPANRWSGIQAWLTNVYWPVGVHNARSVVQWNLALDPGYAPRLQSSYCASCTGSLTLSSQSNPQDPYVTYNDQMFLTAHFSAASTDLTRVGGGQAVRVAADQGQLYSLKRTDWQCLNWLAYAAPLNGASLQQASSANGAQVQRRLGLVMANTCEDTKNVVISSDGRRSTFPVKQGLTTFVWTAP